ALVRDLSQDEMDARPTPDSWSAGEILDHLLRSEAFFRRELRELIARDAAGRRPLLYRGLREFDVTVGPIPKEVLAWLELPVVFMSLFVPSGLRDLLIRSRLVPARHPTLAEPRRGRPAEGLRKELADSLAETET